MFKSYKKTFERSCFGLFIVGNVAYVYFLLSILFGSFTTNAETVGLRAFAIGGFSLISYLGAFVFGYLSKS